MPNDLTLTSTSSRPVSLVSASNEYLSSILNGRCDQAGVVDALRDLFGLYYQPDETAEQRARHIAMFVQDLADMSDETVHRALRDWRKTQDRRPSPAAIRQLCMSLRHEATEALRQRIPMSERQSTPQMWIPATPEQLADRQEIFARCAKEAGFVSNSKGQWVFPQDQKPEAKREPHWIETERADDPRFIRALKRARASNPLITPAQEN